MKNLLNVVTPSSEWIQYCKENGITDKMTIRASYVTLRNLIDLDYTIEYVKSEVTKLCLACCFVTMCPVFLVNM